MLLDARKIRPLERLYAGYGRRLLRKAFARVWLGGAAWPATEGPIIALLNHSAWWDPILALFLSHDLFRRDGYGIMQGAQLIRYPFFRRIGCFGATTESLEDARAVFAYAARLLREGAKRTLWIFPQGELLPARTPLAFRSGAARLARSVSGAKLLPVAVRYEFRAEQRAECFVRIGEPVSGAALLPAELTRRLEHRLRHELLLLDQELVHPEPPRYRVVLSGGRSLSALYDRTFGRLGTRVGADSAEAGPA